MNLVMACFWLGNQHVPTNCDPLTLQSDDAGLQARARALTPLDRLRNEAKVQAELNSGEASIAYAEEDYLAQGL
jgi:hypothetical protein